MLVSSETFPFDSVVMTNRSLSRVRPATLSGHGSSRCHARLRWSTSLVGDRRDARRREQLVEDHPVQVVDPRPRQVRRGAPGPSPGHSRRASRRPWRTSPRSTPWARPNSSSSRMMLERQSTTVPNTSNANACGDIRLVVLRASAHHGSSTTLPSTPPSARLCNAAAPFDERKPHRRRWPQPGLDQLGDTELEHRLGSGLAVDVFAVSDADDADVAQQQPVDLDRRDSACRKADHQQPALGVQRPDRVVERLAADGVDHQVDAAAVGVVLHRLQPAVGQRQHDVGTQRLHELDAPAGGAPSRSPWRPAPLRSERRPSRRRRPSRAPAPSRPAAARRGGPARSTSSGSCPAARRPRRRRCRPGCGVRLAGGTATCSAQPPSIDSAVTRWPGLNSDS